MTDLLRDDCRSRRCDLPVASLGALAASMIVCGCAGPYRLRRGKHNNVVLESCHLCGDPVLSRAKRREAIASLLSSVDTAISRFGLLKSEPVVVALSGGKDSILLCLILRELSISMQPVVVDMGYRSNWGQDVCNMVTQLGLDPTIIDARGTIARDESPVALRITKRLKILDSLSDNDLNVTPCTSCYSVKAYALAAFARDAKMSTVAFGQHMTDAIASFLKEGLMHIDRWRAGNARFDRQRFAQLVGTLSIEMQCYTCEDDLNDLPLLRRIGELANSKRIDTDEPPRQSLDDQPNEVELVRPMFLVGESDIIAARDSLGLQTCGSGCEHSLSAARYTPREMIHYGVLRQCELSPVFEWLTSLVLASIDAKGRGRVRSRLRRGEFLGEEYKPTAGGLEKL